MPFKQETTIERIFPPADLPGITEGDWVEILTISTAHIRRKTFSRAMDVKVGGNTTTDNVRAEVDMFTYRQALMEEIVQAWSDPEPVTPENLGQMDPKVQDWINQQYERLTKRTDEEKNESRSLSSEAMGLAAAAGPAN